MPLRSQDKFPAYMPLLSCVAVLVFAACRVQAAEYKVYLLGGQSNGDGRALSTGLPAELQPTQADVRIYYDDMFDGISNNPKWQDLRPGLSGGYGFTGGVTQFGPEVTFGRTMAEAVPDENIAIIKYSPGGTNLYSQWKATDPTGPIYQAFLQHVNDALQKLLDNGDTYSIAGMLWMQGENDTGTYDVAHNYETNLTNFVNAVRNDVGGAAGMKFVIGQISSVKDRSSYYPPYDEDGGEVVRQAQYNVSRNLLNASLVVTQDLPLASDVTHYTAVGQRALGERFANSILVGAKSSEATIGYWRFEKSLGFASDASGNCLTLTRGNGDATTTDEPVAALLPSSVGRGVKFDKNIPRTGGLNADAALLDGGDYFKCADEDRFGTHNFTIEAYFNRTSSGDSPVLASQYNPAGDQRGWVFGVRSTSYGSQLYLYLSEDGVTYEYNDSLLAAPVLGNDYYAAVSFDETKQDGGVTFYLKNLTAGTDMQVDVKNHTIVSLHDSAADFCIGARADLNCKFSGLIDEVRLSSRVLEEKDLLPSLPAQGDADRNGKVDEKDAAIMADNWLSGPNALWAMGDFNGDGTVNDMDAAILAANWHYGVAAQAAVPEPVGIIHAFTVIAGFFLYHYAGRLKAD